MEFLINNIPNLLFGFPGQQPGGLLMSVLLAFTAVGIGFLIAVPLALARNSRRPFVRAAAAGFIQLFRGIPLIVLLLLVHQLFGFGRRLGLPLTPLVSAVVALTLFSSAYQAEIVRSGLLAVPLSLAESGRLLGGSKQQTLINIQLRYAFFVMVPALTGQAISLFKDTSVVVILGVAELMTVANIVLGSDVTNAPNWLGLFMLVGIFYFIVAFTFSSLAQRWENRRPNAGLVYSLANY